MKLFQTDFTLTNDKNKFPSLKSSLKLLPILTSKHATLKIHRKLFSTCVSSVMLHGSETLAPNADLQQLHCNDRSMIRWMCSIKLQEEVSSDMVLARLGLEEVTAVLGTRHLQWFGHVSRADLSINSVTSTAIPRKR